MKTIQWPLHLQSYAHGIGVKPDTPAYIIQFTNSLQAAATTAGIDSTLKLTDTQGLEGERTLLPHSHGTMLRDVMEEYVGPSTGSSWEQRRLVEPDGDIEVPP
jgi:hypothetical protein